jgi:uncharacterized protein (DUF1501 family)
MRCDYSCQSAEHGLTRRGFLRTAGSAGLGALAIGGITGTPGGASWLSPAVAAEMSKSQKRILTIFLHGGVSQLETWDPKPNTDTGGPFRPISTSVPGIQISELLPHTAKQMHHLSLVRSINTKNNSHGTGAVQMQTGHNEMGAPHPHLGAVVAKALTPEKFSLPGHILIRGGGSSRSSAAFLGPRYGSVVLEDGKAPQYSERPSALSLTSDERRQEFRRLANDRFADKRRTADTDAYTYSYDQAMQLMAQRDVFDVSKEPARDQERYGSHEFGKHCLLARRLLEKGVPFVQVNHSNYDTHFENFDYHIEQLGEFDRPFATLISDLAVSGLLKDTLVVVMSEFGRTPKINSRYGRDHWGTAWSVCLGGAGLQAGAVIGKTNDNGTAVVDREIDHGHLFHTYLQAVGIPSSDAFTIAGRKFPIADPAKGPIKELLA